MLDGRTDPRFVDWILDWPGTWFVARLALVGAYLVGGVTKFFDFPGAVAEQAHFGLSPPAFLAVLTIVVETGAALLLVWGRFVWFAAGALGVFTGLAAIIANNFWAMPPGQARFMAMNAFFEHIGLIAGFVMAALVAELKQRRDVHGN
jgi:uncharacterized membrane protein YphA (DoxX/SURF4 family)